MNVHNLNESFEPELFSWKRKSERVMTCGRSPSLKLNKARKQTLPKEDFGNKHSTKSKKPTLPKEVFEIITQLTKNSDASKIAEIKTTTMIIQLVQAKYTKIN